MRRLTCVGCTQLHCSSHCCLPPWPLSNTPLAAAALGSTLLDFNRRSLYTVLLYLNECEEVCGWLVGREGGAGASARRCVRPAGWLGGRGRLLTRAHRALHFECRASSCLPARGDARGCLALAPPHSPVLRSAPCLEPRAARRSCSCLLTGRRWSGPVTVCASRGRHRSVDGEPSRSLLGAF